MTLSVGETISVVVAATNPLNGLVISDATGEVLFYAPGKNPAKVPGDRTPDHGPAGLIFDASVLNKDGTLGAYVAYTSTTGWVAGKWSYRATLTGTYNTWEYGQFTLAP